METASTRPPRELLVIGGNLALDFANTVDDPLGPLRHDHASTYADIVRWSLRLESVTRAQAAGLLAAAASHPEEAATTTRRGHELRDVLNATFGSVAEGSASIDRHWTRLRPFVADAFASATLTEVGTASRTWAWPQHDELGVVLHPVAAAAADLLVNGDLRHVKRCARCPWLFLDGSKNHSRRWCDMNDCGRAQKIERYVARRAAARARRA